MLCSEQQKQTKVITIKNLTYKDRLKRLKLPTLKYRRIRGDMIEAYKILTNKYDSRRRRRRSGFTSADRCLYARI